MKSFMIATGNFIFRWRDTVFTFIILGAFALLPWDTMWWGGFAEDAILSIAGGVTSLLGLAVRGFTTGFAFVQRAGLQKKIHAEAIVSKGVYAHCRNPLYIGNLLIVLGSALAMNMVWFYVAAIPFFVFIYMCIVYAEETYLAGRFGETYAAYTSSVNRWIPAKLGSFKSSIEGMDFSMRRVIKKEHGTITYVLVGLLLFTLLKFHVRYQVPWTDNVMVSLYLLIGAVFVFQVVSAILKRMGRLEWGS